MIRKLSILFVDDESTYHQVSDVEFEEVGSMVMIYDRFGGGEDFVAGYSTDRIKSIRWES